MYSTNRKQMVVLLMAATLTVSCGLKKEESKDDAPMEMNKQQMSETYVDTMVLHKMAFNKQIVCNGPSDLRRSDTSC